MREYSITEVHDTGESAFRHALVSGCLGTMAKACMFSIVAVET